MVMSAADQLVHCTTQILTSRPDPTDPSKTITASGTGFFLQLAEEEDGWALCLVTNKHVIQGATGIRTRISLKKADVDEPDFGQFIDIDASGKWFLHPDPDVDIAVLTVSGLIDVAAKSGFNLFFRSISYKQHAATSEYIAGLQAIEDVIMIGYPNGLSDKKNNVPIVRRGITATPLRLDHDGKPQFVIDCASYPGSSGSPVFLYSNGTYPGKDGIIHVGTRVMFLGILWGGPTMSVDGEIKIVPAPLGMIPVPAIRLMINLGYCFHARCFADLDQIMRDELFKAGFRQPPA
jgi:hypothetical protein